MSERTVLHYRVGGRLGAGASGDVYLAEDLRLHRPVALKMLRADEGDDLEAGARLLREARVASALSHPNIAVVYEVGEAEIDGRRRGFIAMEHVPGTTLLERLRTGAPLGAEEALAVVRQVAEALSLAHEQGVVHRDVKPGNVMVTERGLVKVLDFGLAKFAPPRGEDAATWSGRHGALEGGGAILGTLAYMSPEQARGADVDARSDVYALGALLYEMLSGRPPFSGGNAVELLEALLRDDPPPLSCDTALGQALADFTLRLLAKDRALRPSDMRAVLREFDELAAGRMPAPEAGTEATLAIISFANLTRNAEDAWLGTGIAETLSIGLQGVPGVSVVSRERVFEVLRKLGAPPESDDPAMALRLGHEIAARYVVSGAYQILGEQVRVTARVTDVRSARSAFTVKVDGTRGQIFALQDRLGAELGAGLKGQLPALRPTDETHSLAAYEAHSKGLLNLRGESRESLDRAILLFEQATALDPAYARAYMHLAAALDWKADSLSLPELSKRALAALDRSLELQPDRGETWSQRGGVLISLGEDVAALQSYERALALNPTDAAAHSGIGRTHFILRGDFETAMASYERALALNPQAGWSALQYAHCAALARDFAKAEGWARRAIELQQESLTGRTGGAVIVGAWVRLGQAHALQGRHAEAVAEYEKELSFVKSVDHALRGRLFIELHQRRGESRLALGDEKGGRVDLDLALEAFERRLRTGADDPMTRYYAACALALRGETEPALTSLEKAAESRLRLTVARGRIEPALESLRGEPRWGALLSRVEVGAAAEARGRQVKKASAPSGSSG